ncbi:MAG: VRR-NUC domain-containing protein [Deltaproteobacteria bacterium]|jgi:rhodanese-related sulfurtransferase|nr:VRR-NUC domain-containing protein [Deltaproteobacteria bacterium]
MTKKDPPPLPSEDYEQQRLAVWLETIQKLVPKPKILYYAVPNGGWRNKVVAVKLKAQGVRPGVPDMVIPVPRGGYHGLYIELKRAKGGQVSAYQKDWIENLREHGYRAEVCAGADAAMAVVVDYLGLDRTFTQLTPGLQLLKGRF